MINSRLVDIPLSVRLHSAHSGDVDGSLPESILQYPQQPVNHVGRSCPAEYLLMPEQIQR